MTSMRERMLADELYLADGPELAERNLRAMDLMEAFNRSSARDPQERRGLLTELLGAIGENTVVGAGAVVARDLPANVVAVGNPAPVIRTIGPGAA
jgi:hypothetical protein